MFVSVRDRCSGTENEAIFTDLGGGRNRDRAVSERARYVFPLRKEGVLDNGDGVRHQGGGSPEIADPQRHNDGRAKTRWSIERQPGKDT